MTIRFPQLSIAQSVVNRILNVHADIQERTKAAAMPTGAGTDPEVPDTADTGAALDAQLTQPTAPSDTEDPAVADAVQLKGLL